MGVVIRFSPGIRRALVRLARKGLNKTYIAELFDTTRQTVHRWCKRAFHRGRGASRISRQQDGG
ncbi:MAG: helix-turn-helix domain-containing protein [Thermoproteota archaeon]